MKKRRDYCELCAGIRAAFENAQKDAHRQYRPTLEMLGKLEQQGCAELVAGDCPVNQAGAELNSEQHYTVCHYFRCTACGRYYFIGACIRGVPVYKVLDSLQDEKPENLLWGRYGTLFEEKK